MAIVTTAKRADFELIHEHRQIRQFMDFVLVREDYERAKPHPEPYLTGLERFGATREETLVVEDSSRGLSQRWRPASTAPSSTTTSPVGQDFSGASHRIDSLGELTEIVLAAR